MTPEKTAFESPLPMVKVLVAVFVTLSTYPDPSSPLMFGLFPFKSSVPLTNTLPTEIPSGIITAPAGAAAYNWRVPPLTVTASKTLKMPLVTYVYTLLVVITVLVTNPVGMPLTNKFVIYEMLVEYVVLVNVAVTGTVFEPNVFPTEPLDGPSLAMPLLTVSVPPLVLLITPLR